MIIGDCRAMHNGNKFNDELMSIDQPEKFKQAVLRLLDDPDIQHKIGALTASKVINVPQRWTH